MWWNNYKSHYKELIKLGTPIVIGQLGMIVLAFADTMMIGFYNTTDLAAASFVNNIINLAIIFATGFSYGLTPIVGNLYGQKDLPAVGRVLKNALLLYFIVALGLIVIGFVVYFNLEHFGQPDELLPLIRPYYIILLFSLIFVLLFNGFRQFADGITETKTAMWILLGGNLFNILGNWVLIYGKIGFPELGLVGAGISTLISRILMVAVFAGLFFHRKHYQVFREGFLAGHINRKDWKHLNQLGWPVGLQMGLETSAFSLTTIMVGWLGTLELAAHQVMLTICQIGFMAYYGMAAAVAIQASNYRGKNDYTAVRRSAAGGFHIILCMALVVGIVSFFLDDFLPTLFTDDTAVQALVVPLFIPFIAYQFGDGLQCNYANALRGISDVKPVIFIAFFAYFIVTLPLGYFFAFVLDWGLVGIWWSCPFGLTLAGILYWLRFRWQIKKRSAKSCA